MQQKVLSVRKGGNWKIWKTYVTSLLHRVAQLWYYCACDVCYL